VEFEMRQTGRKNATLPSAFSAYTPHTTLLSSRHVAAV
jgi:hypothetical protein